MSLESNRACGRKVLGGGGLDGKEPGRQTADFCPPTIRGLANRRKRRESGEGKASGRPRPSTPPSAAGQGSSALWPRTKPGWSQDQIRKVKRNRRLPKITHLPERTEGRNRNLLKRKYLRLRGAPGLHFPASPRGTRAAAPPPGAKVPTPTSTAWIQFPRIHERGGFVFSPSGIRNASKHAQHWIVLFYFPSGSINTSALSWSGSAPITGSVETTRPRILCRAELPACLQFYFESAGGVLGRL